MEKLIFEKSTPGRKGYTLPKPQFAQYDLNTIIPDSHKRKTDAMLPEISEIEVARHFQRLSHLNFNIEKGMYPLGSCTMKYNPKVNEKVAALSGFAELHPHTPDRFSQGALKLIYELGQALMEITGLQGVSLQPAAGSQGEFTGILMIREYHKANGDSKRNKILIPDSAHGTNPASAAIGGMQVVSIKSNDKGRIDLEDLAKHCNDEVAGLMLTNPNTLGLFESDIVEIAKLVRGCGGLMYMDGANLNALLSIARPGDMQFDCVHINLHKTFSTPHGGGGPGAGPVCISERLLPFLPSPRIIKKGDTFEFEHDDVHSVGRLHGFYGNFGVLVRAFCYISMQGPEGLKAISENAIINANYLLSRLKTHYHVPYDEYCMHECIISGSNQKKIGVTTRDIAKRLLDYGFHAPTVYFPLVVNEAMLIEPTETENMQNLTLFADAMDSIAIESIENKDLVLNAPITTPVRRLDEALANRKLNLKWGDDEV